MRIISRSDYFEHRERFKFKFKRRALLYFNNFKHGTIIRNVFCSFGHFYRPLRAFFFSTRISTRFSVDLERFSKSETSNFRREQAEKIISPTEWTLTQKWVGKRYHRENKYRDSDFSSCSVSQTDQKGNQPRRLHIQRQFQQRTDFLWNLSIAFYLSILPGGQRNFPNLRYQLNFTTFDPCRSNLATAAPCNEKHESHEELSSGEVARRELLGERSTRSNNIGWKVVARPLELAKLKTYRQLGNRGRISK